MDANITRIDIERAGQTMLYVRYWSEGWQEGQEPDREDIVDSSNIPALLAEYERQGFTCEMATPSKGRALRGKIVRVDFVKLPDGWHIKKYCYGWTAKTRPLSEKVVSDASDAINWCRANGWTVLEGKTGYRAFKGAEKPVFDAKTIQNMRSQNPHCQYDLAYYGGIV